MDAVHCCQDIAVCLRFADKIQHRQTEGDHLPCLDASDPGGTCGSGVDIDCGVYLTYGRDVIVPAHDHRKNPRFDLGCNPIVVDSKDIDTMRPAAVHPVDL